MVMTSKEDRRTPMEISTDEDDVSLLKQSQKYIQELGDAFEKIEDIKNERELDAILHRIEPYQEDPQLLDAQLGRFIPLLSTKFLENLHDGLTLHNLSKILYTFCKVRGEKVVVGLLHNEVKWIEPLLAAFAVEEASWERNYITMLWLSHLMLSPFDLATISSFEVMAKTFDFDVPNGTPSIAVQALNIGLKHLEAATIERRAAGSLLNRLCMRQDMLDLGLLEILTSWALREIRTAIKDTRTHAALGMLYFLSGVVAAGNQKEFRTLLARIYKLTQGFSHDDDWRALKSSAVARKLVIKVQRDVVIHCIQQQQIDLDTTEVVEEVVGSLIEALADSDTLVRMAAAKAISLVVQKLDQDMSSEIVDAILDSFMEGVSNDDGCQNLNFVNPARWHGIALAFGHLLHKRAIAQSQLPRVINAIITALNFEQRSMTGKSIGANVRDAANYGLWALARRFSTESLTTSTVVAGGIDQGSAFSQEEGNRTSIHSIALHLVASACLDPDGNVRRGSSAALQELIGRHPNMVVDGISLVQIVDYQAVGLKARASTKVALEVSLLDLTYRETLLTAAFDWRGIKASGSSYRADAAVFIGMMARKAICNAVGDDSASGGLSVISSVAEKVMKGLRIITKRDMEQREGLYLALSWQLSALYHYLSTEGSRSEVQTMPSFVKFRELVSTIVQQQATYITSDAFNVKAPRSELILSSFARLHGQLAAFLSSCSANATDIYADDEWSRPILVCMSRDDQIILAHVPNLVNNWLSLHASREAMSLAVQWMADLSLGSKHMGKASSGRVLALGASFHHTIDPSARSPRSTQDDILRTLLQRYLSTGTEARIVVLQSLTIIIKGSGNDTERYMTSDQQFLVAKTLLLALHDYTISDRGDVGSLVRAAALAVVQEAWSVGILTDSMNGSGIQDDSTTEVDTLHLEMYSSGLDETIHMFAHIQASVLRLSLEKLDRVRLTAIQCLRLLSQTTQDTSMTASGLVDSFEDSDTAYLLKNGGPLPPQIVPNYDLTSEAYFTRFLTLTTQRDLAQHLRLRIVEGFCSTAGGAGSGASQTSLNARQALHVYLSKQGETGKILFASTLQKALDTNIRLENDQRLVSILEVTAFVLEMKLLPRQSSSEGRDKWSYPAFFATIQRAQYKSRNIVKLQVCLDVYRSLAGISETRNEVLKKVCSMLLHPLPAIRLAAAETVLVIAHACDAGSEDVDDILLKEDWTKPASALKECVVTLRDSMGVA